MHIDYLRFSTYDFESYTLLRALQPDEPRKLSHWLQYHGEKSVRGFYGSGLQRGRPHYVSHVSGPGAHKYASDLVDAGIDDGKAFPKRIDLAHDIDTRFDLASLYDCKIAEGKNATLWRSQDGDTIYINSRRSEFMVRLYHKEGATRLEFECKNALAAAIFSRYMLARDEGLIQSWAYLLHRAQIPPRFKLAYKLSPHDPIKPPIVPKTPERLQWALDSILGIERLAQEHEYYDTIAAHIAALNSSLINKGLDKP